jgi:hypothetical protein
MSSLVRSQPQPQIQSIPSPPPSAPRWSVALEIPRETRRSYFTPRNRQRDEAGSGYDLSPGALQVKLADGVVLGTAVRMSTTSVWFEPEREGLCPYGQIVEVLLESPDASFGPFSAKMSIETVDDDVRAVAKLLEVKLDEGQLLVAFLLDAARRGMARPAQAHAPVQTEIKDPVRLRVIMQGIHERSAQARVLTGGSNARAFLVNMDDESGEMLWSVVGLVPLDQGPFEVEVDGYNSVFRLRFDRADRTPRGVVTGMPSRAVCLRYRQFRRVEGVADAVAKFEHPQWPELPRFERPLVDVSFAGIAFAADPVKDALYVGLRIDRIEVVCDNGRVIHLRGTVRSLATMSGAVTCGVSVVPAEEDAFNWTSFVMNRLNQTTAHGEEYVDQLWELYTESGYFNLSGKGPEEFESIANSFRYVMAKTKDNPWLSFHAVWPSPGRIESSASAMKAYATTWVLHQLAKRRVVQGSSRRILRDTYLRVFEHVHADSKATWVLCYHEANVRWTHKAHVSFAHQFEGTGLTMARPFRLMEAYCRARPDPRPSSPYSIRRAGDEECDLLLDVLESKLPRVYRESADLVAGRLEMNDAKKLWHAVGLERDREIWVARHRGTPVAAAILEVGETGTNLFRLLDSLRLFTLVPGGEAAYLELIEKARSWFLAKGKESFVYIREEEDAPHVAQANFRDLGDGIVWALHVDLVPDFLELICELLAEREAPESSPPVSVIPGLPR